MERPFRSVLPSGDTCAPSSRPTGSIDIVIPPSGPCPRILRCRRSYTTTSCAVKDFFQARDETMTRTTGSDGPARLGDVLRAALARVPEAERLADHAVWAHWDEV